MDYSKITLGEMLSSENETIKRNAVSILKVLQNGKSIKKKTCKYCNETSLVGKTGLCGIHFREKILGLKQPKRNNRLKNRYSNK